MAERDPVPQVVTIRALAVPPNPERSGVTCCVWTGPGGVVVIERSGMPTLLIPPDELARAAAALGLDAAEFGPAPDDPAAAFDAIREAGGDGWDAIDDPIAYLDGEGGGA